MTPLHVAARTKNSAIAALLLRAGANPHLPWTDDECTPLHLAAERNDTNTATLLLDHGAVIDKVCGGAVERAETALHIACIFGHVQMTALLLSRGADTECRGRYGTALGFALQSRRPSLDVLRLLQSHGAQAEVHVPLNPTRYCAPPYTANLLYIAIALRHPKGRHCDCPEPLPTERRKDCMALLLAHGAKVGATMEIVLMYLEPLAAAAETTTAEVLRMVESLLSEALEHAHGVRRKVPVSSPLMSNLDAVSCEIAILFRYVTNIVCHFLRLSRFYDGLFRLRIDLPLPEPLRWFYFNTSSEVHTLFMWTL
jgi:hypothetical protein